MLDCQRLFGYDGITVALDPSMQAEALGCELDYQGENEMPVVTGRLSVEAWLDMNMPADVTKSGSIPVAIETAKRLRKQVNSQALCCTIGGIRPLMRELLESQSVDALQTNEENLFKASQKAQKALLQWCKQIAELRPDLLVIREDCWDEGNAELLRQLYQPIVNFGKYFRVPVIFQLSAGWEAPFPFISNREVVSTDKERAPAQKGAVHSQAVGQVLPSQFFASGTPTAELEQLWHSFYRRQHTPFLLTTACELAWETDVDRLKDIHDVIMN